MSQLQAEYTIEFHNKSGPYRSVEFTGTRREANARAMNLIERSPTTNKPIEGFRLHFHRYLS